MSGTRYYEALLIWTWIQWKLPPQLWFDAQEQLAGAQPTITTPALASGLQQLLNPATTTQQRLLLLRDLLQIIKDGPNDPGAYDGGESTPTEEGSPRG